MQGLNIWQQRRKAKQLAMAVVFILVVTIGWYYPLLGFFIPLCMILGVVIGLSRGRKWCDWYCPRGSFYESLVSSLSRNKDVPAFMKGMRFRVALLVFLFLGMTFFIIIRWPDLHKIGSFFVLLLTASTLLGILLGAIFHSRAWCTFCPIGTIVNLVGGGKRPLKISSRLCVECRLCNKTCPMRLSPFKYKKDDSVQIVKERDCLKCDLCTRTCPKRALGRR